MQKSFCFVQNVGILIYNFICKNIEEGRTMKERQKKLITYIIEEELDTKTLLVKLNVSKRTLYYDIEELNYLLKNFGQIKRINKKYYFVGDHKQLNFLLSQGNPMMNYQETYNHILYCVLSMDFTTIDDCANELAISRNSVVNFINQIKRDLLQKEIYLEYDDNYVLKGNEYNIRQLYISMMYEDNNILNNEVNVINLINEKYKLELTDFSKAFLGSYYKFVLLRNDHNHFLKQQYFNIHNYDYLNEYLKLSVNEFNFFIAFMKSLSSTKNNEIIEEVHHIVDRLLDKLDHYAIKIIKIAEFKRNIHKHLESSYYRIKYGFPIQNLILEDLKSRNNYIYKISKSILTNEVEFPELKGIKDEEIAFIASYIGGYINNNKRPKNKILIVCPYGLMTSNIIKQQLLLNIPAIEIVDMISLSQLEGFKKEYDFIISTIDIDYSNLIVVNQILTKLDIQAIISQCFKNYDISNNISINPLIDLIKKSCSIKDLNQLEKDLNNFFNLENREEQYMLDQLVNRERIQIVDKVKDWQEAITIASSPLIKDESINKSYVDSMINAIKEHGPYIVLQDRFAMPHASNTGGVNRLSVSILVIKEAVDLMGKEVNIFFVLAPIDNASHLNALVAMTELFSDIENINKVINGNEDTILQLIKTERS